jgi:hypothetical protein
MEKVRTFDRGATPHCGRRAAAQRGILHPATAKPHL